MKTIESLSQMQQWALQEKLQGKTICFVPTMGALHEGHLSLLHQGKKEGESLVLSIFVNPTQFGPNEDLEKYPKSLESDLEKARASGVDVLFLPSKETIYPNGFDTFVELGSLAKGLCGLSRPNHFRGVATVVLKLFNIVQPDIAMFGQKDFQQLKIIEKMATDFNLPIKIIGMPIVREQGGLAMSSRNKYLSTEQRQQALTIFQGLQEARKLIEKEPLMQIKEKMKIAFQKAQIKIDYINFCNAHTLEEVDHFQSPLLIAVAGYLGKTRLIDNLVITD